LLLSANKWYGHSIKAIKNIFFSVFNFFEIFQASKSASRDKKSAGKDLEETLIRLNVEYIYVWQSHDVRTETDLIRS